jgi:hypothetical protein
MRRLTKLKEGMENRWTYADKEPTKGTVISLPNAIADEGAVVVPDAHTRKNSIGSSD